VADQKEPTYDSYTQADAAGTPCVAILATALTRYIKGVMNFAKYRQWRPDQLGPDEIRTYEAVRYRRPRCRLRVILRQEEAVRLIDLSSDAFHYAIRRALYSTCMRWEGTRVVVRIGTASGTVIVVYRSARSCRIRRAVYKRLAECVK
jgi:hypothetical protein